jgi:signal transduction histidine kinase
MARELHDVVANHLSAVAIHATAAQSIAGLDEAKLAEILAVIRDNSVRGLAEMRRLVEVLREPDDPADRPRLADAVRLLETAPGLLVKLEETGTADTLPPEVDHAAYRIVQESLTNASKHSAGGSAVVRLEYRPDRVVVTVDSSGGAVAGAGGPAVSGAGMGLRGMAERVALLGGAFSAGPHGEGWRVRAELPA